MSSSVLDHPKGAPVPEATTTATTATKAVKAEQDDGNAEASGDYVVPVVHVHVPAKMVNAGFWCGLVGAVALGAVDPPLGVLVGAGVLIARHQSTR
jgi:hypothetical protein